MKKTFEEILAERKQQFEEALRAAPKEIRRVAEIIRGGSMRKFRKFLRRQNITLEHEEASAFRDYLTINRVDLKPLEPAARARLRVLTLKDQDVAEATDDFRDGVLSGADLRCRDCMWFVTAPNDDDGENHDKSCVALGTRGADKACVGFMWDHARLKSA